MHSHNLSPVRHRPSTLHVHEYAAILNLAPLSHLVGHLHVVLVLVLNKGVALGLACRSCCVFVGGGVVGEEGGMGRIVIVRLLVSSKTY